MRNDEFESLAERLIQSLPAQNLPGLIQLPEADIETAPLSANRLLSSTIGGKESSSTTQDGPARELRPALTAQQESPAQAIAESQPLASQPGTTKETGTVATEINRLAVQLQTLQRVATENRPVTPPKTSTAEKTTSSGGASIGSTLLKTVGYTTGLGPVISGILSLFGSGSKKVVPDPIPFTAPSSLNVSGGLDSQRNFTEISYAQNGLARSNSPAPQATSPARVEVHVQALDSRSFIDHSHEIAQAVQSAMLQSHSLNDVVSEI